MQYVIKIVGGKSGPADFFLVGGIGHQPGKVVNAQAFHRQPLKDGLHDLVKSFVLCGLAQGDAPVAHQCRQGETPEYLAVEVFYQQAGKALLPGQQRFARRIGDKERKPQTGEQNDHQ